MKKQVLLWMAMGGFLLNGCALVASNKISNQKFLIPETSPKVICLKVEAPKKIENILREDLAKELLRKGKVKIDSKFELSDCCLKVKVVAIKKTPVVIKGINFILWPGLTPSATVEVKVKIIQNNNISKIKTTLDIFNIVTQKKISRVIAREAVKILIKKGCL